VRGESSPHYGDLLFALSPNRLFCSLCGIPLPSIRYLPNVLRYAAFILGRQFFMNFEETVAYRRHLPTQTSPTFPSSSISIRSLQLGAPSSRRAGSQPKTPIPTPS